MLWQLPADLFEVVKHNAYQGNNLLNSKCHQLLVEKITELHTRIRDAVTGQMRGQAAASMSNVVAHTAGDLIFALDKISEGVIIEFCEAVLLPEFEFVLIAEGLPSNGALIFPRDRDPARVPLRIVIDPIDGTRPLMYDKRSAWILTGVADNRGDATSLQDIFFAMQTEIPTTKQDWADTFWAFAGETLHAVRQNLMTGEKYAFHPQPSAATTLDQGYASFVHFFHGSKEIISRIDEALAYRLFGATKPGHAWTYEDQYMSTGGQIYELVMGRDRFIADLRALLAHDATRKGGTPGLCCHPYDLCTELVARAAGVIITDAQGRRPRARLDVTSNIDWIGYANPTLRARIEPELRGILTEMGLLETD